MSTQKVDLDITSLHPWWRAISSNVGDSGLWKDDRPDITMSITIGDTTETYRLDSVYQVTVFDEMGSVYRTTWFKQTQ